MEIPQKGNIQYSSRKIIEKVKQDKKMVRRGGGLASAHKARIHTQKSQHHLLRDENRAGSLKGRL